MEVITQTIMMMAGLLIWFILLGILFLKDTDKRFEKLNQLLLQPKQSTTIEEQQQDGLAILTLKDTSQEVVTYERTFSCKGKDLQESLDGINVLMEMAKKEDIK